VDRSSQETRSVPPLLIRDLAAVVELTRDRESAMARLERLVGRDLAALLTDIDHVVEPTGRAA